MTAQEYELNTVFTKKSLYIGLQLYRKGKFMQIKSYCNKDHFAFI